MKKIFILLLLLTLAACKQDEELINTPDVKDKVEDTVLSIPSNIVIQDELLMWDTVEGATSYSIHIGSTMMTETSTEYSFAGYANGAYEAKVKATAGSIESAYTSAVTVTIESHKPHIVSLNKVTYANQDIGFMFELYQGTFTEVSGNGITSSDYVIEDSKLTVNASYIDALLLAEPERETIILGYVITSADEITIGYLFIDIE